MNINYRKATSDDAYAWYRFKNKVWRDAYKNIFPEEVFLEQEQNLKQKEQSFNKRFCNNDEKIAYIAEHDGKIVGLMFGTLKSTYDYFHQEYADLVALYIDPKYQGRGIGTELKNIFEKWAKEHGATKYVIGVLRDNHRARQVYERWGGKLSKHEEDFITLGVGYGEVFYLYDL